MKKYFLACCFLLFSISMVQAQNQQLYIPRNIKQAYQNGTRSKDGAPGKNYWQNHGVYTISVSVNPPDRTVKGSEQITYTNNSPDTLKSLVYKLIINNHKPGAVRQGPAREDYMTSGIHIDKYEVNGTPQKWDSKNDITHKRIKLAEPLVPGASVKLAIDWHYKVSVQSGREGAIDSTTFYLAYFYPRVAVYDDYNGWDQMNFTGSQEFYNDFNDYTVNVTVPKNFLVWGTGTLQNPDEVLQPEYAKRLKASMTSDSVMHIATPEDLAAKNITAQNAANTWTWKAGHITDMAMAISDHYNWDAGSVVVDDKTGRRASVQAAYNDDAEDFHHMVDFGKHALGWLSRNWPGVPYPFPKTTLVRGFADMEYPMMVNDSSTKNLVFSRFVAEHELAHSWFPFYMGINETRWGFMDEGWATTFEYLIETSDLGKEKADRFFKQFRVNRWTHDPSSEAEIPIITPGNILSGRALGDNEYGKAALGYLAVKDLLGDDGFRKALHGFIDRWHGKHPMPWDFFYSVNDISGRNLNWFWNNWFFSRNYMDIAINNVNVSSKKLEIKVDNIGGFAIPFDVIAHYADGSTQRFHQTPVVWKNHPKQTKVTIHPDKKVSSITLDGGIYVDADTTNNTWTKQ